MGARLQYCHASCPLSLPKQQFACAQNSLGWALRSGVLSEPVRWDPQPVVLPDERLKGEGLVLWARALCVSWLVSVAGLEPPPLGDGSFGPTLVVSLLLPSVVNK